MTDTQKFICEDCGERKADYNWCPNCRCVTRGWTIDEAKAALIRRLGATGNIILRIIEAADSDKPGAFNP